MQYDHMAFTSYVTKAHDFMVFVVFFVMGFTEACDCIVFDVFLFLWAPDEIAVPQGVGDRSSPPGGRRL